jgi:hypothetical protein
LQRRAYGATAIVGGGDDRDLQSCMTDEILTFPLKHSGI